MSVTNLSGDLAHELPTELAGNTVLDYGDRALMVQCGSAAEVLAWTA
ncbi:allophanate hydrolase, partial [Mycobacterium kansasii]